MPEVPLDFPRQWVEFTDPADAEQIIRADLTWLTSRWTCIFGNGCQGIYADRPHSGCCALGAHFSDRKDRRRVAKWVERLDETNWQKIKIGKRRGWFVEEDGGEKTRVVGDACIFHNDRDFEGGYGCALHHLAASEGVSFVETKPDVCWQLPIRRTYERRKNENDQRLLVMVIGEYDRRGWGPGGHELDWYCSGNTEAHVAAEPVYRSSKAELIALMGEPAYEELARICQERERAMKAVRNRTAFAAHPADPD